MCTLFETLEMTENKDNNGLRLLKGFFRFCTRLGRRDVHSIGVADSASLKEQHEDMPTSIIASVFLRNEARNINKYFDISSFAPKKKNISQGRNGVKKLPLLYRRLDTTSFQQKFCYQFLLLVLKNSCLPATQNKT